jgi:hypothetical protein
MNLEDFEKFVKAVAPQASCPRRYFMEGAHEVPHSALPLEVGGFYDLVSSHHLLPHYEWTQDRLLRPSSVDLHEHNVPANAPVYLMRECQWCWVFCIMKNRFGAWKPYISRDEGRTGWRAMATPILDLLIGYVFEMLTFNSYLTSPAESLGSDAASCDGSISQEDAIRMLAESSSHPFLIFRSEGELEQLGWECPSPTPTEYWFDPGTRFLWRGRDFASTEHAVRLPHPRSCWREDVDIHTFLRDRHRYACPPPSDW